MKRDEAVKAVGATILTRSMAGKAYDLGFDQGHAEGREQGITEASRITTTVMMCIAMYALHDEFGFGRERIQRFVTQVFEETYSERGMNADALKQGIMEQWGIDVDSAFGGA